MSTLQRAVVTTLVAMLSVATLGCRDRGIDHMIGLKEKVCACKTAACVDDALKALDKVGDVPLRRRVILEELAHDMVDCMAKTYSALDTVDAGPDAQDAQLQDAGMLDATSPKAQIVDAASTTRR